MELEKKAEFQYGYATRMAYEIKNKIAEMNEQFFVAAKEGRKESLQEDLDSVTDLIDNDGIPV